MVTATTRIPAWLIRRLRCRLPGRLHIRAQLAWAAVALFRATRTRLADRRRRALAQEVCREPFDTGGQSSPTSGTVDAGAVRDHGDDGDSARVPIREHVGGW